MNIELQTDSRITTVMVDGYQTTRVALSDGHGRAIGLVFAAFGDGQAIAEKIVKAFNYHDELVEQLRITTAAYKMLRELVIVTGLGEEKFGASKGIIETSEDLYAEVTK